MFHVDVSNLFVQPLDVARVTGHLGQVVHNERRRRRWTLRGLSERCGVSITRLHAIESGAAASIEVYAAIAKAFGRRLEVDLVDPRSRGSAWRDEDPVHAAMGELEAVTIGRPSVGTALDEPYQHFQFAGRGDFVAWSLERGALLHLENRTRFPNLQEAFGSYNAKRRWLASAIAERLGRRSPWASVTHAMVVLWSAEAMHTLRMRTASFRAICPDGTADFAAWWEGRPPSAGVHSTLVVLDPAATGRRDRRRFIDLDAALTVRPRHRDYAAALAALRAIGAA